MKVELEQKLIAKFPKIFYQPDFGFEISDGWYQIIESLCSSIQSYIDWKNNQRTRFLKDNLQDLDIPEEITQVTVEQIKEKFGGLRFYYEGGDDRILGMVTMAEYWADNTCEYCGKPGERRQGGWIKTLCEEHHNERNKQ